MQNMNDDDGTNDDMGEDADDSSSQHSANDSSEQQQYQGLRKTTPLIIKWCTIPQNALAFIPVGYQRIPR